MQANIEDARDRMKFGIANRVLNLIDTQLALDKMNAGLEIELLDEANEASGWTDDEGQERVTALHGYMEGLERAREIIRQRRGSQDAAAMLEP